VRHPGLPEPHRENHRPAFHLEVHRACRHPRQPCRRGPPRALLRPLQPSHPEAPSACLPAARPYRPYRHRMLPPLMMRRRWSHREPLTSRRRQQRQLCSDHRHWCPRPPPQMLHHRHHLSPAAPVQNPRSQEHMSTVQRTKQLPEPTTDDRDKSRSQPATPRNRSVKISSNC
jgi:hypothetical protein